MPLVEIEPAWWKLSDRWGGDSWLGWGGVAALGSLEVLRINMLVLTAQELLEEESAYDEAEFKRLGLSVYRFGYDDDSVLMASDSFKASLCEHAVSIAGEFGRRASEGPPPRCLVTCAGGYNRSGLMLARIYHELTGYPGHLIVHEIRKRRPLALHRQAFREWVETWEGEGRCD